MAEHADGSRAQPRGHFGLEASKSLSSWSRLALALSPGLARLHRIGGEARRLADPFEIAEYGLRELDVRLREAEVSRIPAQGPAVITANHPFGGLDGLAAIVTIGRRRRDLRILANAELARIQGLAPLIIPVDPFGGSQAARGNAAGLRQALKWLAAGGSLLLFPAGEVSHLHLRTRSVTDPPWSATAARLIRLAGAPVTPMYIAGTNSALFQLAGLVHPRLRTLLLPSELANKSGARVEVRIGEPITPAQLRLLDSDEHLAAYLRLATYSLDAASERQREGRVTEERVLEPVAPAVDADRLAGEMTALPPEALLVRSGCLSVYVAQAAQLPWTLQELGRLRELTFRAVGEGTGRSADIDLYDEYYEHLVLWDAEARRIAGAYRLGRTDVISRRFGRRGLYTSSLFDYGELFLALLGPALELGRSFVREEYQKSFGALLMLWKGIAEYVSRNPRYCRLIGPVSISNDYRPLSRELLVAFLRHRGLDALAASVRPKRPFRGRLSMRSLGLDARRLTGIEDLSRLVAGVEPDGKGAPVLLRQYLRLGGRVLGFSVDPDFAHSLDCLVLVDLRKTDRRVLRKYMSEAAWRGFQRRHRSFGPRSADGRRDAVASGG